MSSLCYSSCIPLFFSVCPLPFLCRTLTLFSLTLHNYGFFSSSSFLSSSSPFRFFSVCMYVYMWSMNIIWCTVFSWSSQKIEKTWVHSKTWDNIRRSMTKDKHIAKQWFFPPRSIEREYDSIGSISYKMYRKKVKGCIDSKSMQKMCDLGKVLLQLRIFSFCKHRMRLDVPSREHSLQFVDKNASPLSTMIY